jgi:hypothetical protein
VTICGLPVPGVSLDGLLSGAVPVPVVSLAGLLNGMLLIETATEAEGGVAADNVSTILLVKSVITVTLAVDSAMKVVLVSVDKGVVVAAVVVLDAGSKLSPTWGGHTALLPSDVAVLLTPLVAGSCASAIIQRPRTNLERMSVPEMTVTEG